MQKFLPPLEICCDKAKLAIHIQSNATVHFATNCETHGHKGIPSPFSKSLMDYEIIVSDTLVATHSKEERRNYHQTSLLEAKHGST